MDRLTIKDDADIDRFIAYFRERFRRDLDHSGDLVASLQFIAGVMSELRQAVGLLLLLEEERRRNPPRTGMASLPGGWN